MNSFTYHAGKFINDSDLNSPQAAQAHKEWELRKYTTQELKDELASREELETTDVYTLAKARAINIHNSMYPGDIDTQEQHDVCKHDMEMGYCPVKGCAGSY